MKAGTFHKISGWYMVFILMLAYTLSFIDRQVLNLLVGPIKDDTGLSDTQISMLQGLAFTASYILMSPVFGRLVDIGSRRKILALGIAMWSLGTAFCGLAKSYTQLFLARLTVGGTEACLTPAAWSILTDAFPARTLPRVFSIYMMGPYLGGGFALIFGGLLLDMVGGWNLGGIPVLGELHPWQMVFVLVGLPGLLVAGMVLFIQEPPREASTTKGRREEVVALRDIWRVFVTWRGFYVNFYAGMSCIVITLYAFPAWMPSVLIRNFDAPVGNVGVEYGVLVLVTGSVGVLTGPWISNWLTRGGRRDRLLILPIGSSALMIVACLSLLFAQSYLSGLAVAAVVGFLYSVPQAVSTSALQLATPSRMRGIASAIYVFAVSVIGLGAAPTVVALITDQIYADEMRVKEALAITCSIASLAATLFLWRSSRHYRLLIGRDTDSLLSPRSESASCD
ncbi:MAG: MFS transporter [Alphaproteobacteria bacterium]|nr:MAG: MFS transporter [Alphaproteobacteria bacterium]